MKAFLPHIKASLLVVILVTTLGVIFTTEYIRVGFSVATLAVAFTYVLISASCRKSL